jgi:uncharacterized membrane protein (DUF2068 family)
MSKQERHGDETSGKSGKSDVWLRVIAIGKLVKVTVLLAVGIAALVAVNKDPPQLLVDAANVLGVDPGSRHLYELAAGLSGLDSKRLEEIGFGSFVYAGLFSVEGVGLWMRKKWGEYATIVITTSFIPIEIYELVKHFSPLKVVTIVLNVAIVVYLVVRVLRSRGEVTSKGGRDRRPAPSRLGIASR